MDQSDKQRGMITRKGQALQDYFGKHRANISFIFATVGVTISVLGQVFGIDFTPYTDSLIQYIISTTSIVIMALFILILQILIYRRTDYIAISLDESYSASVEEADDNSENETQPKDMVTDGGKSNLPPRDRQGKFKQKKGGTDTLILVVLAGTAGFVIADSFGIDPVGGALIGAAILLLYQS